MSVISRTLSRLRFALVPAVWFVAALALTVQAQPPEPLKKTTDSKPNAKAEATPKELPGIRLPDGTFLWLGPVDGQERVSLTPQQLQKLLDENDQLRKQVATRRAMAPSGCAIRGRVEKRGEQLVAILKLTLSFQTTVAKTPVALGGKKAFLVSASLDGNKLPILDTVEDGLAAMIEAAGDHTLTLDLEAPVTSRGAKPELGFEMGLPRAPITTLLLDPPGSAVKRVNLTTRTPDPAQPARPSEARRVPALDVKQLAARPGQEHGYALGPVESVEVTWDPPAAGAQAADQVQSAEIKVAVLFTEGIIETTAKFTLRGPGRDWKVVAPANASISADRAPGTTDFGPAQAPAVTKPASAARPEWKIEFPAGSSPADWIITAVTRQPRPKADDPKHRGPYSVGPFAVLDVLRQTGTVRVTAGPHMRFVFKHGPDLRRDVPPVPAAEDLTSAFFRLTTGPTGNTAVNAPLFTVEAWRLVGRVTVKPNYKLLLTDAGWKLRAEVKVSPIDTEIDSLAVEVPTEWRGLEAGPPELVEGVQPGAALGFWKTLEGDLGGDLRALSVVRFAASHKPPFDLVLTATIPVPLGTTEAAISLARFPGSIERGAMLTATVHDGLEVRGEARGWEGERAATWGTALVPVSGNGKSKAVTTVSGRADSGLGQAVLTWSPYRPDLITDVRADVTLFDRQLVVQQAVKLRSPDGMRGPIHFRGPATAAGVKFLPAQFPLEPVGPGEWKLMVPIDAKEFTLTVSFAIPLASHAPDDRGPWKLPVGLLWPVTATRAETTVRVWSNTVSGRTIANLSSGWRELSIEPASERDALPVVVLSTAGAETPLVLETSEIEGGSAVAVWVDRGLVQAWSGDDGAARYRARFLLRRWLVPAIEMRLPGPLTGPMPEFLRDGRKVEATSVLDDSGERIYRVPLPEPRPDRTALIEVRYQFAPRRDSEYLPPLLTSAAFAGPLRWQVTVPPGSAPLLSAGATAQLRWRWQGGLIGPAAIGSTDELEHWLRTGDEPRGGDDSSGEIVTARQATPAVLVVHRVPRIGFTIACSVVVFVLGLLLTRLPAALLGAAVALVVGLAGIAVSLWPQPAAEVAAACEPGLLAVVLAVLVQLSVRWYYRHRVTHLPGFTLSLPEPSATSVPIKGPSTARNRALPVSSSGAAPVAPAGG